MTYWLGFNDVAKVIAGQQRGEELLPCYPSGSCWSPDRTMEPNMKRSRFGEEQIIGGLDVSEVKRLKALEEENAKLKRLYADTMLENAALKELLSTYGARHSQESS